VVTVSTAGDIRRTSKATIAMVTAAVIVALCAVLLLGDSRNSRSNERAEAQYTAVPVSAFTGRATGPLKVSFVNERAGALDDCSRFF